MIDQKIMIVKNNEAILIVAKSISLEPYCLPRDTLSDLIVSCAAPLMV